MRIRPRVDVILCCYNQEQFISKAVESILCQKVDADVRVIVADDFSTDNTLNIVKSYEEESPFPFVYLQDSVNVGLHANYHRAFATCQGDYTAILEGDDWWRGVNHLSQHVTFLSQHRRYSMSFNRMSYYFQNDKESLTRSWPYAKTEYVTIHLNEQICFGNQIGNLSACVFKTKLLQSLPEDFFKLNYADWELGMMMALHGPIAMLCECTSVYRINDKGQWSSLSNDEKVSSELQTLENVRKFLPSYCSRYIKSYKHALLSGQEVSYSMPWWYRIRRYAMSKLKNGWSLRTK